MKGLGAFVFLAVAAVSSNAKRIVLTNDDGWAVAQIRAQFDALVAAGHDVILSSPADNESAHGALEIPATPRFTSCEFNSCPAGASTGTNASDTRLNWINAFPADAAQHGIEDLAPKLWNATPEFVVSGPNVGGNTGLQVFFSGTLGAAGKAAQLGIPSVAFSGSDSSTIQEAWTALDVIPASSTVSAAETYASLATTFVTALLSQPTATPAILPAGITLNVNFPTLSSTCGASDVKWVFTRVFPVILGNPDVVTCNNGGRLPQEGTVVGAGCYATVSVVHATTKVDVSKSVQADVLSRLANVGLTCYSS